MNKKIAVLYIGLLTVFISSSSVYAYTAVDGTVNDANVSTLGDVDTSAVSTCIDLKSDLLRYRSSDASTNGEVSILQDFLASGSFLKSSVTGYFGLGTFSAVKQFQRSVGLTPTGYAGPLTRAKIKTISCSGDVGVPPTQGQRPKIIPPSSLPPQPPYKQQEVGARPSVYASSTDPFCQGSQRFCPNGSPMPRDPSSCVWMESKCGPAAPGATSSPNRPSAAPPTFYGEGSIVPPRPTSTPRGVFCTMEARLCSDGSVMARNMNTCEWIVSSCPQGSTGRVIVPEGASGGGAPSVPAHGVERAPLGGGAPVDVP